MIVPGVPALQKFIRNGLVSKDDAVANRDEEGTVAGEHSEYLFSNDEE